MHVQFLSRSRHFWDWSRIIPNWWRSSTEIRVLDWLLHAATNQRTAKVHVRVGFRSRYKVNFWPCKHASKSWNLEPSILLNARLFEANLPFLAKKSLVVCFDFVKALNWEHSPFCLRSCILAVSSLSWLHLLYSWRFKRRLRPLVDCNLPISWTNFCSPLLDGLNSTVFTKTRMPFVKVEVKGTLWLFHSSSHTNYLKLGSANGPDSSTLNLLYWNFTELYGWAAMIISFYQSGYGCRALLNRKGYEVFSILRCFHSFTEWN